jgi:hypothetical protein
VWSVNPVFDPTGEFPGWNQATADAATAGLAVVPIPSNLKQCMSNQVFVTGFKLDVRDDVTDALIGTSTNILASPIAGNGTPVLPAQAATVISLRTDSPGASGRGRLYWPAQAITLTTALRMNVPSPSAIVTDAVTYFHALQAKLGEVYVGIGFNLAVRSRKNHSTPHVTRIQVGNVIDTQRRRRDNLPEAYNSGVYS